MLLTLSVGSSYSLNFTGSLALELIVGGLPLGDRAFVDFGGTTRAIVSIYDSGLAWGWVAVSGGWLATAHLSFPQPGWLGRLDLAAFAGLELTHYSPTGDWERYNLEFETLRYGFCGGGALGYFLSEALTIRAEGGYWGELGPFALVGATINLAP